MNKQYVDKVLELANLYSRSNDEKFKSEMLFAIRKLNYPLIEVKKHWTDNLGDLPLGG